MLLLRLGLRQGGLLKIILSEPQNAKVRILSGLSLWRELSTGIHLCSSLPYGLKHAGGTNEREGKD